MKPSSLFTAIFFISLSVWLISIDGKKGSKTGGSKKGSNVNGCLEYETDCTDRMTSAKGSNPSVPYQIWCKAESKEKCLPKAPKSHSIDYEKGRCSFCSLVHPSPPPLLHGHLRSPGCFHSVPFVLNRPCVRYMGLPQTFEHHFFPAVPLRVI